MEFLVASSVVVVLIYNLYLFLNKRQKHSKIVKTTYKLSYVSYSSYH